MSSGVRGIPGAFIVSMGRAMWTRLANDHDVADVHAETSKTNSLNQVR